MITGTTLARHEALWPMVRQATDLTNDARQTMRGGDADDYPYLPMHLLEPIVAQTASPPWESGQFRSAVSEVAIAVSQYAQWRIDRHDLSEPGASGVDLVAFSVRVDAPHSASPPIAA